MTITVGASVRVTAPCRRRTQTGTVAAVVPGQHHPYAVAGLAHWELWFGAHELEAVHEGATDGTGATGGVEVPPAKFEARKTACGG